MGEINWKSKYQELKMKFMNAVDTAFRLGFEQGQQQAQIQQAQEQAAQAQAQQEAMMAQQQAEQGGAPGEERPQDAEQGQPGEQPAEAGGSELDQHINTLESMISKSELSETDVAELKKSLDFLKSQKQDRDNKAALKAIKGITQALKKPAAPKQRVMGEKASVNLNPVAKSALTMQEKIVSDIMKSWEQEEQKAGKDIVSILSNEGLVKKG